MKQDTDPAPIRIERADTRRFDAPIGARIRQELLDAIDLVAADHNARRSDVIRAALEAYDPIRRALSS